MLPYWRCRNCTNNVTIPTHHVGPVICPTCNSHDIEAFIPENNMSNLFNKILDECKAIHAKKSHDYASEANKFSNFEYAAQVSAPFKNDIDRVFATLIGIKLARWAELRNGKKPNNESMRDSHLDEITYSVLWAEFWDSQPKSHFVGYKCGQCSAIFEQEQSLLYHLDIAHEVKFKDTSTHD